MRPAPWHCSADPSSWPPWLGQTAHQLFGRLVLGWIDSYDRNQILIFSGFSRSTRFSHFCTAQISKFQRKNVQFFAGMKMKFHFPFSFFDEFRDFSAKIWWNFAGISQKWLGNDKLSRDFVKKCEKNSEKCQKFPEIVKISIFHSIFPFVSLAKTRSISWAKMF